MVWVIMVISDTDDGNVDVDDEEGEEDDDEDAIGDD